MGRRWECRAAQSRQACPEEAQEPSSGTAEGTLAMRVDLPRGQAHVDAPRGEGRPVAGVGWRAEQRRVHNVVKLDLFRDGAQTRE